MAFQYDSDKETAMGTGIRGVWEVRQNRDGERRWVNAGDIDDSRSYQVFATLAGVRAETCRQRNQPFTTIAEPRGLPDDLGETAKTIAAEDAECDMLDNPSWLTLRELIDAGQPWLDYLIARGAAIVRGNYRLTPDDIRMVFWFS